ncbi:MoxR family ATPase [Ideonella sp. 4Y11]|uniref:MoxR family ATPase n=1 Tax=Ideonella aquatica TaxID=2824119 RepID=A0A941BMA0_9BURK|nr:MoxR family ATPase [Ideonella aquatica]MBQ0961798.1 MoxR family ATPase [Ideonella aquatica]
MTTTPRSAALAKLNALKDGEVRPVNPTDGPDGPVHQWSTPEIDAVSLALACQRPLLVRGEPGTGKTQLAHAVAGVLGWAVQAITVNARTEADDLIYRFDAVRRLADAQAQRTLDEPSYWEPGPLWLAYDWSSAQRHGSHRSQPSAPPAGHVLLIDEIDKAESDLPNSLLELLGQRRLVLPGLGLSVNVPPHAMPLTVFTTNEERQLPQAFVRRCVVLNLEADPSISYTDWLFGRGQSHFGEQTGRPARLGDGILRAAATQLVTDRHHAQQAGVQAPGLAEYLDLLGALHELAPGDPVAQDEQLKRLSAYAFLKAGSVEQQPALSQRRPFGAGLPQA